MNTYAGDAGCGGSCLIILLLGASFLVGTGYGIINLIAYII